MLGHPCQGIPAWNSMQGNPCNPRLPNPRPCAPPFIPQVPVGGSIIASPKAAPPSSTAPPPRTAAGPMSQPSTGPEPSTRSPGWVVGAVNRVYPGRAAMAPLLDLLMTLLHWGEQGLKDALAARERLVPYARQRLQELADRVGKGWWGPLFKCLK